jgi:hypothetical protein
MHPPSAAARGANIVDRLFEGNSPSAAGRDRRNRGLCPLPSAPNMLYNQGIKGQIGGRERSASTADGYRYAVSQYLGDWRRRTVEEIGRDRVGVRERHRRITEKHGRATADSVMRVLRAVYNRARREHPDLASNPVRTSISTGSAGGRST